MNIVFVGSTVDRELLKSLPDASVAGNKMQMGFVKGFIENGIDTAVISVEPHGMWRGNKKPLYVKRKRLFDEKVKIDAIPYLNLPLLKQVWICSKIKREIKKLNPDQDTVLIVYNTMSMFAMPVLSISQKKGCKSVAIIADLPIHVPKNIFRRLEDQNQENLIQKFDGLIPLTKLIATDFAPELPYCLVEAGCNPADYVHINSAHTQDGHSIVFSGTLNYLSGIDLVISAMKLIPDSGILLHIYGSGPLEEFVRHETADVPNIVYHGRVNNDEMMRIQAEASLLVCPRRSDDYTTKYTFPSKVLEYLCAGVPVLANRLAGIPEEYDEYLLYSDTESAEDWAAAITKILGQEYPVHRARAKEIKAHLLQTKSWEFQCNKVIRFFKSLR